MELKIASPRDLVGALLVGVLVGCLVARWNQPRYELKVGNDGAMAWKFDRQTGEVKVMHWGLLMKQQQPEVAAPKAR